MIADKRHYKSKYSEKVLRVRPNHERDMCFALDG